VLCLTIGHVSAHTLAHISPLIHARQEGTAVYTSGVDQKITQFALIKASASDASSHAKWVQTTSRRLHSHDVRALAAWPPYTPLAPAHQRYTRTRLPTEVAPILASGGLDMSVVLTPAALARATAHRLVNPLGTSQAATFEDGYQRRIAYATGAAGTSALRLARTARVLMLAADAAVSLWRIAPRPAGSPKQEWEEEEKAREEGWEKILEMELNVQTNIIASAISDDASWLVVSDAYETKLFSMVLDVRNWSRFFFLVKILTANAAIREPQTQTGARLLRDLA
jgi:U3 small nucleolar RNA-associated protein 4